MKAFARGCMRTYLILKEKADQWNADPEIQELLVAQINADDGLVSPHLGDVLARARAGAARPRVRPPSPRGPGPAVRGARPAHDRSAARRSVTPRDDVVRGTRRASGSRASARPCVVTTSVGPRIIGLFAAMVTARQHDGRPAGRHARPPGRDRLPALRRAPALGCTRGAGRHVRARRSPVLGDRGGRRRACRGARRRRRVRQGDRDPSSRGRSGSSTTSCATAPSSRGPSPLGRSPSSGPAGRPCSRSATGASGLQADRSLVLWPYTDLGDAAHCGSPATT